MYSSQHERSSIVTYAFAGEGRKRSRLSVPATSDYTLGGADVDLTNMDGQMRSPDGVVEPCILKKLESGKLGKMALYSAILATIFSY